LKPAHPAEWNVPNFGAEVIKISAEASVAAVSPAKYSNFARRFRGISCGDAVAKPHTHERTGEDRRGQANIVRHPSA